MDKETYPIMISSSEPDDSSPLKPTSPVADPSSPQPMASSSPRPFETGLLNKTSSPKLNMPKLGERYAFYNLQASNIENFKNNHLKMKNH